MAQVEDFLEWMSDLDFKYKILIRGNHDLDLEQKISLLDIPMPDGITQLDHSGIVIEDIPIWGVPFPKKWTGINWGKAPDTQWADIPLNTQVLMTHQPPYSILDLPPNGLSRGERGLLEQVKKAQPQVHLFGHIHASYGQQQIGDTLYMNASLFEARVGGIVNAPFVFEI